MEFLQLHKKSIGQIAIIVCIISLAFYNFLTGKKDTARYEKIHQELVVSSFSRVTPEEFRTHGIGNPDAPYSIIYYTDYDCPYCKSSFPKLASVPEKFPLTNIVVRHSPLSNIHPFAFNKALIVECIVKNNDENFFDVSSEIFSYLGKTTTETTASWERTQKLDIDACLNDSVTQAKVLHDQKESIDMGLYTTPSVLLVQGTTILARLNYVSESSLNASLTAFFNTEK